MNLSEDIATQPVKGQNVTGTKLNTPQKKCVLIYDDDLEILFLCKAILSKSSYRVETLSCCENVLEDVARIKPDIILMDLWIPEIGGEKAIEIVKTNPETNHIPMLIFSANAEIATICKKVNANGFIEKPFDISGFNEAIQKNIL